MKQWERKLFIFLSAIFIVLALLLIALAFGSATRRTIALLPTPTGYEDEFFALRLKAPDLPRGYQGQRIPDLVKVESGTGYDYIFELQPLSDSFK